MLVLPTLPPKDHILKDVNQNQKSCHDHTPYALPRTTQTSLAKFAYPILYKEDDKNISHSQLRKSNEINPKVIERWTDEARAFWVTKPGKNDRFLHDIYKNYSVLVSDDYDARYKHKEQVFNRSFKYELECLEEKRLQKLHKKMRREEKEEEKKKKVVAEKDKSTESADLGIQGFKSVPPFWWEKDVNVDFTDNGCTRSDSGQSQGQHKDGKVTPHFKPEPEVTKRWQDEPNLVKSSKTDPCQRRNDLALFGQPFKHEACNWYYNHYPSSQQTFIRKKFK